MRIDEGISKVLNAKLSGLSDYDVDGERSFRNGAAAVRATVEKGAENPMAQFAQQVLLAYGYSLPQFGADGEFGEESVTATIRYQQDHGLVADGVIGVVTWKDMLQIG